MKKRSGLYPSVQADAAAVGVVSHAGGLALLETVQASGLGQAMSEALAPWRKPTAVHDPAKVLLDLAVSLPLGGDCLADIAVLRAEPGVYGPVASDPTVSRTIDALASDGPRTLAAINSARAAARAQVWQLAGQHAPDHEATAQAPLVIDVDATLVTAHSDKQHARPTFKRGYGHHPLWAFVDHGADGTGEPLAVQLRPGNAGSNTAADHITVLRDALRQLPDHRPGTRPGRKVLVRVDGAGATHALLDWLTGQRLSYSVGFTLPPNTAELLTLIPDEVWQVALDSAGGVRDGAWVAELTGLLDVKGWPPGMRIIARKERPHPGAQLRITDVDGLRVTAFATNTASGQLAKLELRHRRRARCEDRIRNAKDTGLANLPLHDMDQNRIWCAVVALACELTRLAADAHHDRPPRAPVGTQTAPATAVQHRRPARPQQPPHRPAPEQHQPLDRPAPRDDQQAAGATATRLLTHRPAPTTAAPPARGTDAHPSELGRTVTATRHNHAPATPAPRGRTRPTRSRKIRASVRNLCLAIGRSLTFAVRSRVMAHLLGYARVSTTEQNPDLQVDELTAAGCWRVCVAGPSPVVGLVRDSLTGSLLQPRRGRRAPRPVRRSRPAGGQAQGVGGAVAG